MENKSVLMEELPPVGAFSNKKKLICSVEKLDKDNNVTKITWYGEVKRFRSHTQRIKCVKEETIKYIQGQVSAGKISPWFGERVAQLIINSKRVYKKKRPPRLIKYDEYSNNFESTFKTDLNQVQLLCDIFEGPNKFGLDDDKKRELAELLCDKHWMLQVDWPKDILTLKIRKDISEDEYKLRRWYGLFTKQWGNSFDKEKIMKMPIADIKKEFNKQCAEVDMIENLSVLR